ncbi:hypothetical protein DEO72_LG2g4100 [Vigna unguiculata]|uniref:Uncharacterized protein n=1 Tax=Vigna unguiculata TaxID=3917 RepID=A0A4D6L5H1_VIGUN|nr:hypothetical protein DEO72_LG2g4100 [Vigna unguiculata]
MKVVPPSDVCRTVGYKALGAWWYVSPTKRSGSVVRPVTRELRQAIRLLQIRFDCLEVRGLQGFGDTSKLWLGMISLELWLGMADEHEELLSCDSGWRMLLRYGMWSVAWFPAHALPVVAGRCGSKTS